MGNRALAGLAQGLGQGLADVGKISFVAQIEEQRERRLAQYRRDEYAQHRADRQADYAQQRADTRADLDDQRSWQSENEQRLYERGRTDSEADYKRNRRDAVADRAHSEARADRAAQMAAQLKADKWSSLEAIKSRDEFGNEQITGFVGSKGGQIQMIDLQSGRIIPMADDQQRLAALSQLDGYELPDSGQGQAQQPESAQAQQAAMPEVAPQQAQQVNQPRTRGQTRRQSEERLWALAQEQAQQEQERLANLAQARRRAPHLAQERERKGQEMAQMWGLEPQQEPQANQPRTRYQARLRAQEQRGLLGTVPGEQW